MQKFIILFVTILLWPLNAYAHDERPSLENDAEHIINSAYLFEKRHILVKLPEGYYDDTEKSYPVLYVLNNNDNFNWASYVEDILQERNQVHEMIVVGLPSVNNYRGDNSPFKNNSSHEISNGAKKFEKFIHTEAIPFVDKRYRTLNTKFIVGHSLAGLFVTHLFTQNPNEFNAYIAISPSFHHGPQMIEILENQFNNDNITNGMIYMTLGGLEHSLIQQHYKQMKEVFLRSAPDTLVWDIDWLNYTDHKVAGFSGLVSGLSWLYKDEVLTGNMLEKMTVHELIQHYDILSERIGHTIKPRYQRLKGIHRFMMGRMGKPELGEKALQLTDHYYPN